MLLFYSSLQRKAALGQSVSLKSINRQATFISLTLPYVHPEGALQRGALLVIKGIVKSRNLRRNGNFSTNDKCLGLPENRS